MDEAELLIRLTEYEKDISSLKRRMGEAEKIVECVHQLAQEMVGLATEIKHMNENLSRLSREVAEMKNKPLKYWEQIITALIAAGAGVVISQIFNF